METDQRRIWRQQVRDALRPEPKPGPPSRKEFRTDAGLAVLLAVVSVIAALKFSDGGQVIEHAAHHALPAGLSPPPPRPPIPLPPPGSSPTGGSAFVSVPVLLAVLSALPLAARRWLPLATFWVVLCAALAMGGNVTWIAVLVCVIGAYSAVAHSRYRVQAMACLVPAAVLAGISFRDAGAMLPGWAGPFVILLVAGVVASLVRFWHQRLRAGQHQLAELEQTQAEAMRRAVELERARIAAELHDVVTHNVSVMVIQTGAARKAMDATPEESKQALLAVETSGRAAMAELRHVMGLLAPVNGPLDPAAPVDGLEPQPGLAQLDILTERVRAAGIPVNVEMSAPPGPLPSGVDLAAYRVVQEALTNTIKHTAGATASVSIGHDGDWLQIEVIDNGGSHGASAAGGSAAAGFAAGGTAAGGTAFGRSAAGGSTLDGAGPDGATGGSVLGGAAAAGPAPTGSVPSDAAVGGRGLIGLRERLAVYGGTLEAGRHIGGGYRIKARLPWRT